MTVKNSVHPFTFIFMTLTWRIKRKQRIILTYFIFIQQDEIMILRDINNSKADFSAFLYDLHTNLKANPDPSRAQLGQLVARALGARSQAALPHLDTPSKQTFIAAPKTAASHKNLFFWTARNGLTPTIIDGKLVSVPLKQLLVDGIPPPCSKKRHAPTLVKHSEALCALDEGDHKRTAWARIYDANNINCKVVKSFARDLNLTPGELEEKYSKGSNHYPFLGLTYTPVSYTHLTLPTKRIV